jgi:UDP-4-amino-4,6-dideoxy-N-acetyl-beta-L-altrosamine N-acetyltransferase
MLNPFLIGDKVYLRPLERADAPLFVRWMNDPEIQRTTLRARPLNLQDEEEFIDRARANPNDVCFLIAARDDDHPVGGTALHNIDWRNRHACFGITIGNPADWNKGYGTEATRLIVDHAFATLNLNRVWLYVLEYNERGIHVYEKLGFKKEGLLRQEHYRQGRYWDTWLMALLRSDWDGRRADKIQ